VFVFLLLHKNTEKTKLCLFFASTYLVRDVGDADIEKGQIDLHHVAVNDAQLVLVLCATHALLQLCGVNDRSLYYISLAVTECIMLNSAVLMIDRYITFRWLEQSA
jgi:hypothetical protein